MISPDDLNDIRHLVKIRDTTVCSVRQGMASSHSHRQVREAGNHRRIDLYPKPVGQNSEINMTTRRSPVAPRNLLSIRRL